MAEKPSDKWQASELCFVCVNYTKRCVNNMISKIEDFIRFNYDIQVLDIEKEII